MAYNPSSSILFITLGSMHQLSGGEAEYSEQDSITSRLPTRSLLKFRSEAFEWLKGDATAKWKGVVVSQLKSNRALVKGRDFKGNDDRARYFPALQRFKGRFFRALEREGWISLYQSRHHVLFLCALYGLMTPVEPIQMYDCPLQMDWPLFDVWTENDSLTNVLLAYIEKNNIARVFDLTATEVRRRLISWPTIHHRLEGNVLHCFDTTGAGDDALIPFADFMKNYLLRATPDELMRITPEKEMGDVIFRKISLPRSDMPHETEINLNNQADDIDRKRRGVIRFLDRVEGAHGRYERLAVRIDRVSGERMITEKVAERMRVITRLRNAVVYREHQLTRQETKRIQDAWNYLSQRVKPEWRIVEFQD